MTKPSILIIPGSFSYAELYDTLVDALAQRGYDVRALDLPSVLRPGAVARPPATMYEDAAHIARETEKLADEGKDVILVPHSYGGVPTSESVRGLAKQERGRAGKAGGLVRVAYMTCLVGVVGQGTVQTLSDVPDEQKIELKVDENGWMYQDPISRTAEIVFADLPREEGEAWVSRFGKHSAVSFTNELTYPGYKDVPVSYLLCEEDLCIPPKMQRDGIQMIESVSGRKVDVTSIRAGHCPHVGKLEEVVDWILDVAGKAERDA